jgi:NAD-dependent SIR2 family protein deacetylase
MWNKYARCVECKNILKEYDFSINMKFFMPVCPKCGAENNVEPVTTRLVYKGKWFNPLTWIDYEYQIKEVKK